MATVAAAPISTTKPEKTCYSRKDFIEEWTFPLHPFQDFELNGIEAIYTAGHPTQWGDEAHWFDFRKAVRDGQPEKSYESYCAAISQDRKLLAISSVHERVLIYHIESQELRQVLDGAGRLSFVPLSLAIDRKDGEGLKPAYAVLCSVTDEGSRSGVDNQLVFWDLDEQGRLLDEEEPINASAIATQAIETIIPSLAKEHEWSEDFIKASTLHADFTKALTVVAKTHRRRHNTIFNDAQSGGFGSTSFSKNGKIFLYHTQNNSTQSGMRAPNELPQVVVVDLTNGKELHRLSGHTDAIMWSAISPDNEHIASVAWDGTLRMYSVETGELEWTTSGGGQAWSGAFSSDSKDIVWSTAGGRTLVVLDVLDGHARSSFPEDLQDWCRSMAWHPDGEQIALCAGQHAYVWRPFDGEQGTITQHYRMEEKKSWGSMASIEDIDWLDNGRLLHLHFSDGTHLIYDTESNTKELFMHPRGIASSWTKNGFHGNIKIAGIQDGYVSVDGDGQVRYWSVGIPRPNSWWDKVSADKSKKASFPETGKYVMVNRRPEKGKDEQQKETAADITSGKVGTHLAG